MAVTDCLVGVIDGQVLTWTGHAPKKPPRARFATLEAAARSAAARGLPMLGVLLFVDMAPGSAWRVAKQLNFFSVGLPATART